MAVLRAHQVLTPLHDITQAEPVSAKKSAKKRVPSREAERLLGKKTEEVISSTTWRRLGRSKLNNGKENAPEEVVGVLAAVGEVVLQPLQQRVKDHLARELFIDNLLVRIHFIIEMIW